MAIICSCRVNDQSSLVTKRSIKKTPYIRLGNGEPLILLHGLGEVKEAWYHQYDLVRHYELIIPDLRGHGENENFENISVSTMALDILVLLNELKIEKAHICGLSMGGIVAQELYKLAPDRFLSLILANTFHYAPPGFAELFFSYNTLFEKLVPYKIRIQQAARNCLYSYSKENIDKFLEYYKPREDAVKEMAQSCLKIDYRYLLRKVIVPTLIIGSQFDIITPFWLQLATALKYNTTNRLYNLTNMLLSTVNRISYLKTPQLVLCKLLRSFQ